ncbi:hypothetical protein DF182_00950 [Chitinophaga flava]|uniref:Uncharacterized protein n=1 Tax=Chitinophaga flava TaxID=2259036 RepID=A0A365XY15_9BACT|nr:hypothetical protein DF182_00950 [Chitinophaga flava]
MKKVLIFLIGILLISCKYKKTTASFHKLDITYDNGWSKKFSVIIDITGEVMFRKGRFVSTLF